VRDDDHCLPAAADGVADVVRRCSRREPLVDHGVAETERRGGLARADERARHDGVRLDALLAQFPAERLSLFAAGRRQGAKLIGSPGRRLGMANDHELHRGQDNRVMTRLGGPVGAAAAFALTVGLAFDGGGYQPVAFDRALVGAGAAALLLVVLVRGSGPGRLSGVLLAALGLLTAWTAASWLWSDSPPVALVEAQRTAVYLAAAAAVVLAGRRLPAAWIAGGIAAGATVAVAWNLFIRLAPDWSGRSPLRTDIGQLADPVGYANSLALLAALAFVLVLGLDGIATVILVPLAAEIALQQSTGTVAALALGLVAYLLTAARPVRTFALLVLPVAGALVVAASGTVRDPPPANLLAAAHTGHRLLLLLVLLTLAQGALTQGRGFLRSGVRVPARLVRPLAVATGVVALVAAPFAFAGHERGRYWAVAWHELAASPVLGSGAGTFADWWLRLRTVPFSTLEAHSLYLETLAELGPLGLALLLVALVSGLVGAWRLRRESLGPALLGALVTYDLAAAVDFHWELAAVTAPAIVLAAVAAVHADERPGLVRNRYSVPALAALTVGGVLALAGSSALQSGNPQRALRFAPYSAEAWIALGDARRTGGDTAGALHAYRRAVQLDPNDWRGWSELAAVSKGEPRRLALARAARLNPLGVSGS
jgi:Tetratricopeptide repeat